MLAPHVDYSQRLEARLRGVARNERLHLRVGYTKLVTLILGLVLAWLSLGDRLFSPYWLLVPFAAFLVLSVLHERVLRGRAQAERAAAFYRRGLMRLEDRWAGNGESGERFQDPKHVYAEDLDLFGRGSLFELLSIARTPMGENRLAQWLLSPSPLDAIVERHGVVAELRDKVNLREQLALAGEDLRANLNPEALIAWAEAAPGSAMPVLRAISFLLALASIATFVLWMTIWPLWPFIAVLIPETILRYSLRRRVKSAIGEIESSAKGLAIFSETMRQLEKEPFVSPGLLKLIEEFKTQSEPAWRSIRKLGRVAYWAEACDNFMVRLVDLPLLFSVQVALAADAWRRRWGAKMRSWIAFTAEMEALLSLAGYSYERPADPFPMFEEASDGTALFEGEDLGHPLVPASRYVRNTVRLGRNTRVLLVSGSNMSGKSTLLRTVGVNAVLAMAGAPVCARSLLLRPLTLGTRIRTADSLLESRSGFYTEILRIRQVFELTERKAPLLFLFDELLEGTNSKDRRIGAEGLLRALVGGSAIGIVTTHDLALTEIVDSFDHSIANAHFQDYVENGEMRFDYRLLEGVVTRSNALELMRLIGLRV